jgi:hypothetical protein
MAFISMKYDGGNTYDEISGEVISNNFVYESVTLSAKEEKFIFNSGNFVKDWFDAKKKYMNELQDTEPYLTASSDINHIQSDSGDKFDSGYLHIINDKPVLLYVDTEAPNYDWMKESWKYEKGWEFFVPSGTKPTWEELKEMCK